MVTPHDEVQKRCDAMTSLSCRRRVIFPTVRQLYNFSSTPVYYSRTKLSDRVITKSLTQTSSVESDMPSLTSLSIGSDNTAVSLPSVNSDDDTCYYSCGKTSTISDGAQGTGKAVRFDPRIWVHEFDRSENEKKDLWFTAKDLNSFKFGALQCILSYNSKISKKTDTAHDTQNWSKQSKKQTGSVLFSHPALGVHNDFDECENDFTTSSPSVVTTTISSISMVTQFREAVAENEIRNILVVDAQEICLKLYTKGLRRMFPHATIITAKSSDEALNQVHQLSTKTKSGNDFDVVIHNENSKIEDTASGSTIFTNINKLSLKSPGLNVIVLPQRDNTSKEKERRPDTDLVWTKPPPLMNDALRDVMLKTLLMKRGRIEIAKKLFT